MRLLTLATSRIIPLPSPWTTLAPNTKTILGRTAACALLLSSTHCCCAGLQTRPIPIGAAAFLTSTSSPSTAKFLRPTTGSHRTATSVRMAISDTRLTFGPTGDSADFDATVIVGKKDQLMKGVETSRILGFDADPAVVTATLDSIGGKSGTATTFLPRSDGDRKTHRLSFCALPDKVSRSNHPMSVHTITSLVQSACPDSAGKTRLVVVMSDDDSGSTSSSGAAAAGPLASAVAKAFPLYSRKTGGDDDDADSGDEEREVRVTFLGDGGANEIEDPDSLAAAEAAAEGVRLAARLADTPPEELTTEAFAEECRGVVKKLKESGVSIKMTEIVGEELRKRGYGGLHGVGKAAACPPRMIIMENEPPASVGGDDEEIETVALVGKGIVYDTGGLALKPKVGMCGMKHDMGGAAGMLGGFYAAAKLRTRKRITLILCVAENAIGPDAFRNDDILTLYSGKTVEVNNSDAEGRLVLGDGVAHATKHITGLDLVVDMATLTGAQMVTTGKRHGAVLANTAPLEGRALSAGMHSGDLCHPLLYAPELLMDEFKSKVADMKNSVKDRGNAQSSCAGHFIESHLDKDYEGGWLHVDMAGPSTKDERGTGYGVGLVLSLLEAPGF